MNSKQAVAIFSSRESPDVLARTILAVYAASDESVCVDVLVNGNGELASQIASLVEALPDYENRRTRIWSIGMGDKANAWNQYFHSIWSDEELVFFIDGYVSLLTDSLQLLGEAVLSDGVALGGSGVPSTGRSAKQHAKEMLAQGGFHGNLCCIRGSAIASLKDRNFRIPIGLYRVDGLVGSVLSFGLDPNNNWDRNRIYVHPRATWITPPKQWWRPRDWIDSHKRRLRQARGLLENAAIKDHLAVRKLPPETLPESAFQLINEWMKRRPEDLDRLLKKHPLARRALATIEQGSTWSDKDLAPARLW